MSKFEVSDTHITWHQITTESIIISCRNKIYLKIPYMAGLKGSLIKSQKSYTVCSLNTVELILKLIKITRKKTLNVLNMNLLSKSW